MSYDSLRYDQVRQKSSHNAFQQLEGIYDQVLYWRIRSLELDLHKAKLGHGRLTGDWYVYHGLHNPNTTVHRLSDFLRIARGIGRAIPEHEIITVFLDIRDGFHKTESASQSGPALDRLLLEGLGERALYRPADLMRAPHGGGVEYPAMSLQEAVAAVGWPTLSSLRGKYLFVLTGDPAILETYLGSRRPRDCVAFLSAKVDESADVPGDDPDVVFFNMSDKRVKLARRVRAAGLVGRGYYLNEEERWRMGVEHGCHHLATDDINAREDGWSTTASHETGHPFQALAGAAPAAEEAGWTCGVWARSGDIWGTVDSFYFQHADRRDRPDNRYELYISGANSFGDDWLKGGLVARASLAGNAAYLGVFRIAEHHRLRVQYRVASGGSTVAEERTLGGGVIDEDTLVFVRMRVSRRGRRARAWGSVDGSEWTEIAAFDFEDPLGYQGLAVSSHREASGAKFLFGIPGGRERPPFTRGRLVGPRKQGYGGGGDWLGADRWKVDGFG